MTLAKQILPQQVLANVVLYVIGPLISGLSTLSWLKPGALLARGDIFPYIFLNPAAWSHRIWYAWDNRLYLGGPNDLPKFSSIFLFSSLLHNFLNGEQVQHVYYALMMALQFAAMAFLVRTIFPKKSLAAAAAAAFYCFNVSMLQVLPFPMFMFLLAYLPFMIALLVRGLGTKKSDVALCLFVILSALSGFLFVNPPTYLLFVLSLAACAVALLAANRPSGREWTRVLIAVAATIAVNMYWFIPSYATLFGAGHESVHAVSDDSFLRFVSRRSTLLNVFWLQPYWAWDYPIYYPFRSAYDAPWLIACSFLPAVLFFSALFNRALSRTYVVLSLAASLLLILLTTGVAPPFDGLGWFLYRHMPLYWLFREPTTKFPLILIVVMAPLVGVQVAWFVDLLCSRLRSARARHAFRFVLAAGLIFATCVPAYPLVTGEIEGARDYGGIKLVSNGIHVPQYWLDLAAYVAKEGGSDRVLMLPNDDFYQINYRWGLYAADPDVLAEFLTNPFILVTNSSYQLYLTQGHSYSKFQDRFYQTLVGRVPESLTPDLAIQGIKYVVQRNDLNSDMPQRSLLSPLQVHNILRANRELEFIRNFGPLELYRVRESQYVPPLYVASQAVEMRQVGLKPNALLTRRSVETVTADEGNPTSIDVTIPHAKEGDVLVYAESFNPNWQACVRLEGDRGRCLPLTRHGKAFGFENYWVLPGGGPYQVSIRYAFQQALIFGYVTSLMVLFLAVCQLAWLLVRSSQFIRAGVVQHEG